MDVQQLITKALSRRNFLQGAGGATAASLLSGCGAGNTVANAIANPPSPTPTTTTYTDPQILNFALNLEYLEAEYYLRAATGNGLSAADVGSKPGAVTGGRQVTFTSMVQEQYAVEVAQDELNHVRLLRKALGSAAVDRPAIDLTNSFNGLAVAAKLGSTFDPFADQNTFLVGAFIFEDVGVTAYTGAAPLISDPKILSTAAGLQATEAYHASLIRTLIAGQASAQGASQTYLQDAVAISGVRGSLGGGDEVAPSISTIVPVDSNALAFARTFDEVMHIVFASAGGAGVKNGGFFPSGLNGTITTTAS